MQPSDSLEHGLKQSRIIRSELQRISEQARQRHPILAHQDAIGLTIFLASAAAISACTLAYAYDALPAWVVVVSSAFFMSLLHELEHDLIHRLYFKTRPWLYNAMMFGVWLFRPSTINPWVRRDWHLHHHRFSGTATDAEERALTNGEKWGVRRALMSLDTLLSLVLRPRTTREYLIGYAKAQKPADKRAYRRILWRNRLSYLPFGALYFAAWHWFLILHFAHWAFAFAAPAPLMSVLDFLAVTVLMPNALRTFCLHFVSSNIHYYGDIETRNIVQQTQVWTAPWLWPLQAFCFNFGSTHAIHHFWVQDPFYLRQLVAKDAHRVMRSHGVRFNDFASMKRANRWHAEPARELEAGWADTPVSA
jgi:fatty acid desaturase